MRRFMENASTEESYLIFDNYSEYLADVVGSMDDEVYDMRTLDELLGGMQPLELFGMYEEATRYDDGHDSRFEVSDDFFTFDDYGNLMSIYNLHDAIAFMRDKLESYDGGLEAFLDWCEEQGYKN